MDVGEPVGVGVGMVAGAVVVGGTAVVVVGAVVVGVVGEAQPHKIMQEQIRNMVIFLILRISEPYDNSLFTDCQSHYV